MLQQGELELPNLPPDAITFPLPSAFPSREGLIFPSAVPEVEAFHDLPFSAVKRAYTVINSPDFERRLSELDPPGLVVIASRDQALSQRFAHMLRGLRRVQRRPFVHIGHLAGSVREVRLQARAQGSGMALAWRRAHAETWNLEAAAPPAPPSLRGCGRRAA